jgi:hypothetical protein
MKGLASLKRFLPARTEDRKEPKNVKFARALGKSQLREELPRRVLGAVGLGAGVALAARYGAGPLQKLAATSIRNANLAVNKASSDMKVIEGLRMVRRGKHRISGFLRRLIPRAIRPESKPALQGHAKEISALRQVVSRRRANINSIAQGSVHAKLSQVAYSTLGGARKHAGKVGAGAGALALGAAEHRALKKRDRAVARAWELTKRSKSVG